MAEILTEKVTQPDDREVELVVNPYLSRLIGTLSKSVTAKEGMAHAFAHGNRGFEIAVGGTRYNLAQTLNSSIDAKGLELRIDRDPQMTITPGNYGRCFVQLRNVPLPIPNESLYLADARHDQRDRPFFLSCQVQPGRIDPADIIAFDPEQSVFSLDGDPGAFADSMIAEFGRALTTLDALVS